MATAVAADVMELPWNLGSFLLFGLGSGLFAFHAWRAKVGARWVNVVGMAGGLSGDVWFKAYAPFLAPVAPILIATNILTIIIRSIDLAVALVRQPQSD